MAPGPTLVPPLSVSLIIATTFDNSPKSFLKSEDITHLYKKASFLSLDFFHEFYFITIS